MLIATLWKWLFSWENQVQTGGENLEQATDRNADRMFQWTLDQREYYIFGFPHYWG